MRRRLCSLAVALVLAAALPMSAFAKKPDEIEHFKERLSADRITVTSTSVSVDVEDLYVSNVAKVTLDDEELMPRFHYTAKRDQETGQVTVVFTKSFLNRQEHGTYDLRVEFLKHSAETTFDISEVNSDYTARAPRTSRTTG